MFDNNIDWKNNLTKVDKGILQTNVHNERVRSFQKTHVFQHFSTDLFISFVILKKKLLLQDIIQLS